MQFLLLHGKISLINFLQSDINQILLAIPKLKEKMIEAFSSLTSRKLEMTGTKLEHQFKINSKQSINQLR